MGARGRVALLGELEAQRLGPTENLAEKIFSCMLCGACKNVCPAGINIPETIYAGRAKLKKSFRQGPLMRAALKHSVTRLDFMFTLLRWGQKFLPGRLRQMPEITSKPFKNSVQVYKNRKKVGRVAVFAGCSVNYLYPGLGNSLLNILLAKRYEVVVFRGEMCCGAPLRASGFEKEASGLAQKNIEYFSKVRAEAIISLCPTCTMVIQEQYPVLAGATIKNIMDVNEFLMKYEIAAGLETSPSVVTYHDPCHLSFGLGMKDEPRRILKGIEGIDVVEMRHADECCGFAGLFSMYFKRISREIGKNKIDNILHTGADTVVTSCPGCIMQLEALKRETGSSFDVRHIVEVIDEAMHGERD
jgi:glycolate oxidase iron-sulfur subunit